MAVRKTRKKAASRTKNKKGRNKTAEIDPGKLRAIQSAVDLVEKKFGKGAIFRMGSRDSVEKMQTISTGSLSLNEILGVGGYPRGRIIEIFGPEAGGKSTLALHAIAQVQRKGGSCVLIDAENSFDPRYASALGIEMGESVSNPILVSQPDTLEQAIETAETFIRTGAVDLIVVDSVAAMAPRAEIEGEIGDSQVGLQARLMGKAMRILPGVVKKTKTCLIFINQVRVSIGGMSWGGWGPPDKTPGGRALKFIASVRIEIRSIGKEKVSDRIVASKTRVKVVKNKVAAPFREAVIYIRFGEGIDRIREVLDLGLTFRIVKKSGSWFSYGNDRLGQGLENARENLSDDKKLYMKLRREVRKALKEEAPF